jgi:hypothetical protein
VGTGASKTLKSSSDRASLTRRECNPLNTLSSEVKRTRSAVPSHADNPLQCPGHTGLVCTPKDSLRQYAKRIVRAMSHTSARVHLNFAYFLGVIYY